MGTKKFQESYLDMLLLKLLSQKDMYGYEIIQEIRERSSELFSLKAGTLYPLLHLLEREGYLVTYDGLADRGAVRKYYRITEEGRRALDDRTEDWKRYSGALNAILEG